MKWNVIGICVAAGLLTTAAIAQTPEREDSGVTRSSNAFLNSADAALQELGQRNFDENLESPGFGAVSSDELNALVANIRRETPIPNLSRGEAGVTYDVVIQPGHYGRTTGRTGASGALVSERALVGYIAARTAADLRARGHNVLVVSADNYRRDNPSTEAYEGLTAKAFLAIHADGSERPCATGPSLGYAHNNSLMAMHAIGYGLSAALGYDYNDFRRDNFTANESDYYMFRRVRADRLTGILEIGEITCAATEAKLVGSANRIADNTARALDLIISMSAE